MSEKIAVIGAGAWGTTIANILAENGHDVSLWARSQSLANILRTKNENTQYLQGIKLNKNIKFYTEFACVEDRDIIFVAVPSQHLRHIAKQFSAYIKRDALIINLAKGIENNSYKRMSEVLEGEFHTDNIATLSGPNHGIELAKKLPTATVIAGKNIEILQSVKKILSTSYFKIYPHNDIIGVEICSAVKNIPAIACGIISELNYGDNTKASIITLGLNEMNTICRFFGAKRATVYGLAGVGDLVVTCTSRHSRNQFVGRELAKGNSLVEIKKELHGMIAEGIDTSKAVYEISQKHKLKMPLATEIYHVLYRNKDINMAIMDLLRNI